MPICYKVENINKEIETMKKNKMDILELKSAVIEIKNSSVVFSLQKTESVNLKRWIEIMQSEDQREKNNKVKRVLEKCGTPLSTPPYA